MIIPTHQAGDPTHNGRPMNAEPSQEFDWESLFESMGEPDAAPGFADRGALALSLAAVFDWCLSVDLTRTDAPDGVCKRLIALAWLISPARFGKASIRRLSRRLGISAAHMSTKTAKARRKFGVQNAFAGHDWRNRKTK